jgi:molecular chaperone DnaK
VPQIEVTFDIDANGIVNVSAKDKGTGKEQHITITSSTNMSKEDIEKAVKDAEKFAAEDKAQKEAVDAKNQAESLIFQSEKTLNELGDKVTAEEKAPINEKMENLKNVVKTGSTEQIKAATEELQKAFYAISEKLYKQTQQNGEAPNGNAQGTNPDGTVNGDFTDNG